MNKFMKNIGMWFIKHSVRKSKIVKCPVCGSYHRVKFPIQ